MCLIVLVFLEGGPWISYFHIFRLLFRYRSNSVSIWHEKRKNMLADVGYVYLVCITTKSMKKVVKEP